MKSAWRSAQNQETQTQSAFEYPLGWNCGLTMLFVKRGFTEFITWSESANTCGWPSVHGKKMASLETCIVTNTMKNTESDFEAQVVKKRRRKKETERRPGHCDYL